MCFPSWCFLFKVSPVNNVMMRILREFSKGSLWKTTLLLVSHVLRTAYCSNWGQKCVKNYLEWGKKRKRQLCKTQVGCSKSKTSKHSLEIVKNSAEKGTEMQEWCRVKWAQALGCAAGKPRGEGDEGLCTDDLVLMNFRERHLPAHCCPPSWENMTERTQTAQGP